ncbi:MAG: hypothetical protein IT462_05585 [Planctomycetes bacterium]|nr:hypothetical protein [Planctomycetota bacterium]
MGHDVPLQQAPQTAPAEKQWDGRTRSGLGIYVMFLLFKWVGPLFAYFVLYPVCFFYLVVAGSHRRASLDYLKRRFPQVGAVKRRWYVYRHFLSFGRVLLDRAYAYLGWLENMKFEHKGLDVIQKTLDEGKGLILLSAHLGNWELSAHALGKLGLNHRRVPINIVMFEGDGERVKGYLKRCSNDQPFNVIASNDSLQASIDALAALRRGEIVGLLGDRHLGQGCVDVPFLGGTAALASGPFVLAANSGAPVMFTFANRAGSRHYVLDAQGPRQYKFGSRKTRDHDLKKWATEYAQMLEEKLKMHPFQWHNFFTFWK